MVKFLINRPIGVVMTFFALILLGIYSMVLLPVSLLPAINIPEITIRLSNPGMPALEMEKSVTQPLRMQLVQVSGIQDLESESRDGEATIKMSFGYGDDVDLLFVEVSEKVDIAMADMSRDIPRPRIIRASATDIPVFNINIRYADSLSAGSDKMMELSQLASKVIRKRFEQLPEVALADITGVTTPEVLVIPDQSKMVSLGVSADQMAAAISQSMLGRGTIRYREGNLVFDVTIEQKVNNPEDIKNVLVKTDDRIFKIGDLASVVFQPEQSRGLYEFDGDPAICLPIIKSTNARMGDLTQDVKRLMHDLHKEYPQLKFDISHDQTEVLRFAISNLSSSLVAGIILAISIMFLFLGDYRSPVLMGVTIPVSLVVGMIFFHLGGVSLNIVSLSGLILGVGMMIDNSIIVIDNITQWRKRGSDLESAVVGAVNEVVTPLLSSMLTTCAVFIPLIFLSGMAGAMFFDQAIAIAIGLGVSFWVSITLMPTIYFAIHRKNVSTWKDRTPLVSLEKGYHVGHNFVFGRRKLFMGLVFLLMAALPLLFMMMDKQQMPTLTRTEVVANISWGGNLSVGENQQRCNLILSNFDADVVSTAFFIGRQQLILSRGMDMDESDASLYFRVDKDVDIETFKNQLAILIKSNYPESVVSLVSPESVFDRVFPASASGLEVKMSAGVSGKLPSIHQSDSIASTILTQFPSVTIEQVPTHSLLQIGLNSSQMSIFRVPIQNVQSHLEVALQSSKIGRLAYEQQVVPIVFGDSITSMDHIIGRGYVKNLEGTDVPVRNLLVPGYHRAWRSIYGDNASSYIPLKINGSASDLEAIHEQLVHDDAQDGSINFSYKGEIFTSKKMIWELAGVLLVSLLLLYFILAAQFESLIQPFIVLIEIPIDIAATLVVLWLTGVSINLMSMIGFVVMGGVVVNDSILKIDTINRLRKGGMAIHDAIAEGGERRIKSITTTSLTTILALIPILFGHDLGSELQQPMAVTLIAGMTIGTLVSVFIVPLVYSMVYREREAK